jgi:hypothetical protein
MNRRDKGDRDTQREIRTPTDSGRDKDNRRWGLGHPTTRVWEFSGSFEVVAGRIDGSGGRRNYGCPNLARGALVCLAGSSGLRWNYLNNS